MLKAILQIGVKKFLRLKNINNTFPWTYIINDLNDEEIVGTFFGPYGGDINVKVDLSNYATKTDLKNMAYLMSATLH